MNKFLILILVMTISIIGHCDTLDYYHVYLNDSLIGEYNSLSKKPVVELNSDELNEKDTLSVRYRTDLSCVECTYALSVLIEVKEKTPETRTNESFGKLSIPIIDLLYFHKKYQIDKYHFNYSIQNKMNVKGVYLFELKLT